MSAMDGSGETASPEYAVAVGGDAHRDRQGLEVSRTAFGEGRRRRQGEELFESENEVIGSGDS